MLNLYAYSFVATIRQLREGAEQLQRIAKTQQIQVAPKSMKNAGHPTMAEVGIDCAGSLANELGMFSTQQQCLRLTSIMLMQRSLSDFLSGIDELIVRIEEDLKRVNFLSVPPDFVPLWRGKELFGPGVEAKFKNAADIENAGKCLAVGQGTACVFHLMRALEVAVRKLGKRLAVTITPKTTWRQITGEMAKKISKMPDATDAQKRKKNAWEEACSNLHHVGSVWRNNTMHPAKTYTVSQARDIFEATRVAMNSLAAL